MASPAPTPPPVPTTAESESVPLAVWPCAQVSAPYQRTGRYLPDSTLHPAKMLPDLARRIIIEYSAPDALVVDPMCGIGTTLVEGAALGRRTLGIDLEARWADLARRNLDHILPPDQATLGEVRIGDARNLPALLAEVVGQVDLVATSPPYACSIGMIDKPGWLRGQSLCRPDTRDYSDQPANLGRARGATYLAEMASVYAACHQVLRPGGLLVTVTKNLRRQGRVLDLAAATVALAAQADFAYLQHVIALHAAVRDSRLVARPSFWQLTGVRKARARGEPASIGVHEDVLVFIRQEVAGG